MKYSVRPAFMEVNINHMAHNLMEVRKKVGQNVKVCAVIKADGYKLGVHQAAQTYIEAGADMLAVAILDEALELRKCFSTIPILVLGYTPEEGFSQSIASNIRLTLYSLTQGIRLNETAQLLGKEAIIHLKVETGMNRLGFLPTDESILAIKQLTQLKYISCEGIYSHLARADELDKSSAKQQKKVFDTFCEKLKKQEVDFPIRHLANSAAIIDLPDFYYDMVRPGIMLTGLYPSEEVNHASVDLKLTFALKAKIALVKNIEQGAGVSYGHTFIADKPMKVATIPIGYADGFSRLLSGKMSVVVGGVSCAILGRICMDQCVIDVTHISSVNIGDECILYGDGTDGSKTPNDVAKLLGTINYEVLTMIDRRVPRVYYQDDSIKMIKNYLL